MLHSEGQATIILLHKEHHLLTCRRDIGIQCTHLVNSSEKGMRMVLRTTSLLLQQRCRHVNPRTAVQAWPQHARGHPLERCHDNFKTAEYEYGNQPGLACMVNRALRSPLAKYTVARPKRTR